MSYIYIYICVCVCVLSVCISLVSSFVFYILRSYCRSVGSFVMYVFPSLCLSLLRQFVRSFALTLVIPWLRSLYNSVCFVSSVVISLFS